MKNCVVKSIKKSSKDNCFYMAVEVEGVAINGFSIPSRHHVYMGEKDPREFFPIGSEVELPESLFL